MGDDDTERATEEFFLNLLCTLRAFDSPDALMTDVNNLLCVSNIYGYIYTYGRKELKAFKVSDVEKLLQDEDLEKATPVKKFPYKMLRSNEEILYISINCTERLLAVVTKEHDSLVLGILNVSAFFDQTEVVLSTKFVLSQEKDMFVKNMYWHPASPDLMAICLSNGKVFLLELKENEFVNAGNWNGEMPISAIRWSAKGKSLVLGQEDGKLLKCDRSLECKKEVPLPDMFEGAPHKVHHIHWISTFVLAVTYKGLEGDSDPEFVIITSQKDGPTHFQNFGDIYFGFNEGRMQNFYSCDVPDWNIVFCASSTSFLTVVIGFVDGKWYKWVLKDSGNADLPLNENKEETFPVGLAVSYNSSIQYIEGENVLPPSPLLLTLSTDGLLSCYQLVNMFPSVKRDITRPIQSFEKSSESLHNKTTWNTQIQPTSTQLGSSNPQSAFPFASSTSQKPPPPPSAVSAAVKTSIPAPVKTSVPAPVKTSVPAPVKTSIPAPVKTSVPAPVKTSIPSIMVKPATPATGDVPLVSESLQKSSPFTFAFSATGGTSGGIQSNIIASTSFAPLSLSQANPIFKGFPPVVASASTEGQKVTQQRPSVAFSQALNQPSLFPLATSQAPPNISVGSLQSFQVGSKPPASIATPVSSVMGRTQQAPPVSSVMGRTQQAPPVQPSSAILQTVKPQVTQPAVEAKPLITAMSKQPPTISAESTGIQAPKEAVMSKDGDTGSTNLAQNSKEETPRQNLMDESESLDREILKIIKEEIDVVSKELRALKTASEEDGRSTLLVVGTRQDALELKQKLECITKVTKALQGCCKGQDQTVALVKAKMMQAYEHLQELQSCSEKSQDPRYIALLKLKPLDAASELRRKELRSKFNMIKGLLGDVNEALDIAFEKKALAREKRRRSLKENNIHNLYRSMEAVKEVTNNLASRVETLYSEAQRRRLISYDHFFDKDTFGAESDPSLRTRSNTSSAGNGILSGKIAASKQTSLRNFLMKRTETPIRRSKFYSTPLQPSFSKLSNPVHNGDIESSVTSMSTNGRMAGSQLTSDKLLAKEGIMSDKAVPPKAPPNTPAAAVKSAGKNLSMSSLRERLEKEVLQNSKVQLDLLDKGLSLGLSNQTPLLESKDSRKALNQTKMPNVAATLPVRTENQHNVGHTPSSAGGKIGVGLFTSASQDGSFASPIKCMNIPSPPVVASSAQQTDGQSVPPRQKATGIFDEAKPTDSFSGQDGTIPPLFVTNTAAKSTGASFSFGMPTMSSLQSTNKFSFLQPTHSSTPLLVKKDKESAPRTVNSEANTLIKSAADEKSEVPPVATTQPAHLQTETGVSADLAKSPLDSTLSSSENIGGGNGLTFTSNVAEKQGFVFGKAAPPVPTALANNGIPRESESSTDLFPAVIDLKTEESNTYKIEGNTGLSFGTNAPSAVLVGSTPLIQKTPKSVVSDGQSSVTSSSAAVSPLRAGTGIAPTTLLEKFPTHATSSSELSSAQVVSDTNTITAVVSVAENTPTIVASGEQATSATTAVSTSAVTAPTVALTGVPFGSSIATSTAILSDVKTDASTAKTLASTDPVPVFGSASSVAQATASSGFLSNQSLSSSTAVSSTPLFGTALTSKTQPTTEKLFGSGGGPTSSSLASFTAAQQISGFSLPTSGTSTSSSTVFQSPNNLFGSTTQEASKTFGQSEPQQQTGGGLFGGFGLGGKPNDPGRNPFGQVPTVAQASATSGIGTGGSLLGSLPAQKPTFGTGAIAPDLKEETAGGVGSFGFGGSAMFGATPTFGGSPSFGGSPTFGGAPAFGSAPSFGGSPSFGSSTTFVSSPAVGGTAPFGSGATFGASPSSGSIFGQGASGSPSFGQLAAQDSGSLFGSAGGQGAGFGGFGGFANTSHAPAFDAKPPSGSSFSSWR